MIKRTKRMFEYASEMELPEGAEVYSPEDVDEFDVYIRGFIPIVFVRPMYRKELQRDNREFKMMRMYLFKLKNVENGWIILATPVLEAIARELGEGGAVRVVRKSKYDFQLVPQD